MEDSNSSPRNIRVVMLPWLAHGHISPFLELAKKLIIHKKFHIFFCSSPVNLNSIKPKLLSDPKFSTCIQLVELHLPYNPQLPPHYHTTKGLPPHLLPTLMNTLQLSRPSFSNILETLKPNLVIYDILPSWVPDVASSFNIPFVGFVTASAIAFSLSFHISKNKNDDEFPFPEICHESMKTQVDQMIKAIASRSGCEPLQFYERSCSIYIVLMKTIRELEGKYMDFLSSSFGKKVVPVGPLVPDPIEEEDDEGMDIIINWLDKKAKCSTVFVSFGSESYLSKQDMEEVAYGLELSNVNFIWVVRFPKGEKMKLEDALPDGFLGRVRERGMIVEDWAPQIKILSHSSIGGFVSHCGWGSFMESMKFGVPIIGIPLQFDQPLNAWLGEDCEVGMEVKRDDNERLQRENVAKVIKHVVVEKNGEGIRRKAKQMSNNLKSKADEDMDEFVTQLLMLC